MYQVMNENSRIMSSHRSLRGAAEYLLEANGANSCLPMHIVDAETGFRYDVIGAADTYDDDILVRYSDPDGNIMTELV